MGAQHERGNMHSAGVGSERQICLIIYASSVQYSSRYGNIHHSFYYLCFRISDMP